MKREVQEHVFFTFYKRNWLLCNPRSRVKLQEEYVVGPFPVFLLSLHVLQLHSLH